ncbi:MAG: type II toxin-antitoxin system VapC family toxin [Deltaproteobacteria bacterium]|nr:type II toxin-antitoxin system VapC family toxin [Deltaproteobacteria bacterium]
MVFIDSNIPMYYTGSEHPNRYQTVITLEKLISKKTKLVTNTEVLQEILHRYHCLKNPEGLQNTWDCLYSFIDEVFSVKEKEIAQAKNLLLAYPKVSSRDAVHAAFMKSRGIKKIFSFDKGFDDIPFIERIS